MTNEVFIFNVCVAVNYVAISDAFGVSPSVLTAGLAADNVICAVYFITLFALASKIPAETSTTTGVQKFFICIHFNYLHYENVVIVGQALILKILWI